MHLYPKGLCQSYEYLMLSLLTKQCWRVSGLQLPQQRVFSLRRILIFLYYQLVSPTILLEMEMHLQPPQALTHQYHHTNH
ncbi:hypothetical protein TorRG33x02_021150 [Trema orientale]|uniref:Uncharacterized protein n=1 Tax=Trema orientale TaxID=63057 RepID=A0A2P5FX02_TREOI|nr:hypothetical protein TorRG33x02_021150 [Trema orientale]